MEGLRGTRVAAQAMMLVMVILFSSSSCVKGDTPFSWCYTPCVNSCIFMGPACAQNCFVRCTTLSLASSPSLANDGRDRLHDYCKLGCASSLCSKISTTNNPSTYIYELI